MVQTVVADPTAVEGMRIRGPWPEEIISRICEGDLAAGRLVMFGTDPEQQVIELPALPAADDDAIVTDAVFVSSATVQTIDASSFDGVIGLDRITPARSIGVHFDAHANWSVASVGVRVTLFGHDATGAAISETVTRLGAAGALDYYTTQAFASLTGYTVSSCGGASGTGTIGVANDRVELSRSDYPGLAVYKANKEPHTSARNFAQYDEIGIMTDGRLMCVPEHAVSNGDQVYVRVFEDGTDLRGQLTGQDGAADPTTYAKLAGAHWTMAAVADGFASVEIGA